MLVRNMRQARVCLIRMRRRATEILTRAMDQFQKAWQMKIRRMAVDREAAETYVERCPKPELHARQTMMYMAMASIWIDERQFGSPKDTIAEAIWIAKHTVAAPAVQSSECNFGFGRNLDQSLAQKSKTARHVRLPHKPKRRGACESLLRSSGSSCLGSKFMASVVSC